MNTTTKPATLLIDGYNLAMTQGTGIATYARNLSLEAHALGYNVAILHGAMRRPTDRALWEAAYYAGENRSPRVGVIEKICRYLQPQRLLHAEPILFSGRPAAKETTGRQPYSDTVLWSDSLFYTAGFNYRIRQKIQPVDVGMPVDIAHFTYPLPVRVLGARNICTIHDLVPLLLPGATLSNKARFRSLVRHLADSYDHIVTVSETSRRDIIELLEVPPEKVTNTWQSVTLPEISGGDQAKTRRDVESVGGLPFGGYFLYYGAIEPKKNVGRLIEAYEASGVAAPLVIAGKIGWSAEAEIAAIEAFNQKQSPSGARIVRVEYVPQRLLVSLIRGARSVLFPSLYEGFGLAVLEAMLLGTPVLTSTGGSLPEIAGDAAVIIDPYDVAQMAAGIRALDERPDLREKLIAKGHIQARKFSPEAYRTRLAALYSQVLEG